MYVKVGQRTRFGGAPNSGELCPLYKDVFSFVSLHKTTGKYTSLCRTDWANTGINFFDL